MAALVELFENVEMACNVRADTVLYGIPLVLRLGKGLFQKARESNCVGRDHF